MHGPGEGAEDGEAGTDASKGGLVVDGFASDPGPEDNPSDVAGEDRVNLTSMGAVAAVVTLGNVS